MSKFRNFLHFSFYLPFLSVASLQASNEEDPVNSIRTVIEDTKREILNVHTALLQQAVLEITEGLAPVASESSEKVETQPSVQKRIKGFGYVPAPEGHLEEHISPLFQKPLLKLGTIISANYRLPNVDMVPVFDQGEQGSCTANALMAIVSYCSLSNNGLQNMLKPSRAYQYYNARWFSQNSNPYLGITPMQDTGAMLIDSILALDRYGCCPEKINLSEGTIGSNSGPYLLKYNGFPYYDFRYNLQPDAESFRIASESSISGVNIGTSYVSMTNTNTILPQNCIQYSDVRKIIQYADLASSYYSRAIDQYAPQASFVSSLKSALSRGNPVYIGVLLDDTFGEDKKTGKITMPNPKTFQATGGHAIWLTGYGKNGNNGYDGYFEFRNSWNATWGNKGYGYFPESYLSYPKLFGIEAYEVSFDLSKLEFKK